MAAFFALYGIIFNVNSGIGKYINTKIIRAKFVRALYFIEKLEDTHTHSKRIGDMSNTASYQSVLSKIENIKFTWRDKFFLLYNLCT
jgi:hypothetical protein